jgi:hypothetical protein
MILATSLQPFTGAWDFAFRLNSTLDRTTHRNYAPEDRQYLLKTLVPITWPLDEPWTTDLLGLLDGTPDLGEVLETGADDEKGIVRPPGGDQIVRIDD